ncbi:MAG TPA: DUF748 domain-containing protein [Candidatus Polarisedimenticolia bacterium]|nr:DUF748 domain-containing protein [Candidatus Polarisedimenticolia bacterium]
MRLPGLPRWLLRTVLVAAAAVVLYAAAGFLILPRALRGPLEREVAAQLSRQVSLRRLRFNPFSLSGTALGLDITDRDGTPLLRWEKLLVNFDPVKSLWRREWTFHEIHLAGAAGRLALLPGGALNVDDIIQKFSAPEANAPPPGPPPVISIHRLGIEDTSLAFVDRSGPTTFTTTLGPLRIELRDFTTRRGENNAYTFTGATEMAESFSWTGHFGLDPLRSDGEVSLTKVTLSKYQPYYRGVIPFDIRGGDADLKSGYRVVWGAGEKTLRIQGAAATVRDLRLSEHDKEEIAFDAPLTQAEGGDIDLMTGQATIARLVTRGGKVIMRKSKEGRVNLLDMVLPFFEAPSGEAEQSKTLAASEPKPARGPASSTAAHAPGAAPDRVVPTRIGELTFADYTLEAEDLSPARPVRVRLDQIALTARGVDNIPGTTAKSTLDLRWNNGPGTLHADGEISLVGLNGRFNVKLDQLDVVPVDPYVEPALDLRVGRGTFYADGLFHADLLDSAHPKLAFQGNVRMDDFTSVDGRDKQDFLDWKSVRMEQVDYVYERDRLRIGNLTINGARGTLNIAPDGVANLATVLRLPPPAPAPPGEEDKEPEAPAGAESTAAPVTPAAPAAPAPPAGADTGDTRITKARLKDSTVKFIDRTMTPPGELLLQKVEGTLAGLSSRPGVRADVHLQGLVGDTAPVKVDGQIDPLGADVYTDLVLDAKGIDLAPLGTYSARYLGYELDRARLGLDMRYHLEDRALAGTNVFTADPFLLGAKTDSPDATHLPVRLGLALLRDRHGVIELDVPVKGSLDDPKFKLGRVILRAVVNVFSKLVTAPFTLLARAFSGGKEIDISLVEFAPGSAAIADGEKPRLETLSKGLADRPGLMLAITGRAAPEPGSGPGSDYEALRQGKLEDLLRAAKWKSLRKSVRETTPVEKVVVEPGERMKSLKAAWKDFLEAHPDAAGETKPETPEEIEARLLPRLEVPPAELAALAEARAAAVRDALVAAGIDTARLQTKSDPTGGARATFELQ